MATVLIAKIGLQLLRPWVFEISRWCFKHLTGRIPPSVRRAISPMARGGLIVPRDRQSGYHGVKGWGVSPLGDHDDPSSCGSCLRVSRRPAEKSIYFPPTKATASVDHHHLLMLAPRQRDAGYRGHEKARCVGQPVEPQARNEFAIKPWIKQGRIPVQARGDAPAPGSV